MFIEHATAKKISLRSCGAKDELSLWRSAELLAVASRCHGQDWKRRFGRSLKLNARIRLLPQKRFCRTCTSELNARFVIEAAKLIFLPGCPSPNPQVWFMTPVWRYSTRKPAPCVETV